VKLRGNKIEWNGKEYIYSDTKEPTIKGFFNRKCGKCGKARTNQGHDACLGTLPGVMNACCGHGDKEDAYVQFLDNFVISGKEAIIILDILKKYKEE